MFKKKVIDNTNYEKSVGGVLIKDNKVLLARHTYGAGNNLLIIPGGYIEKGESPEQAIIREYAEETSVEIKPISLIGVRFNMHDWYAVFKVEYVSGIPESDGNENSEVIWIDIEEALSRDDVADLSKSLIKCALSNNQMEIKEYRASEKWAPQSFYGCI